MHNTCEQYTHIFTAAWVSANSCIPKTKRHWWMWGEPTLSLKSDQERLFEGNTGGFRLCVPFKLDVLGGKPIDCVTLPIEPRTVHSNFTSQDTQQAFVSSPPNIRWSQWPSLHPTWESSLGRREAILRKGRYVLCWHWESLWVTGSGSTAIALFKMQNVDVFRGHISINHCMQILPVERSFPCKSLLTALIELMLVTEGMLNSDGPLIVLSQEKINKRQ